MFVDTFNSNQLHITIKIGDQWFNEIANRDDIEDQADQRGAKVRSPWLVVFKGRKRRIYCDCSGNVTKHFIFINKVKYWIH